VRTLGVGTAAADQWYNIAVDPLDELPLEVLLALHEALADPASASKVRAAKRAADLGFHVEVSPPPRYDPEPIPMEEAAEGVESLTLRFDR
jgi:hypothetical protein